MRKKIINKHQPLDATDVIMFFFKDFKKENRSFFQKESKPLKWVEKQNILPRNRRRKEKKSVKTEKYKKIGNKIEN